jgi:hypothetical protein
MAAANSNTKRGFVSILVLVCIASSVIQVPQFLVSDWKKEVLQVLSGGPSSPVHVVTPAAASSEKGLWVANVGEKVITFDAAPDIQAGLWVKNATLPGGNDTKKSSVQPKKFLNTTMVSWEGLKGMGALISRYWKGNLFCEAIREVRENASDSSLPMTMNISFGCEELFRRSFIGTGNFLSLLYGVRLAAQVYENVDIHFVCPDVEATKKELILPWFTGWFPPRHESNSRFCNVTIRQACGNYDTVPIAYMYKEMQYDLRRMAIGLVGVPGSDHPSAQFAEKYLWSESGGDESFSVLQLPVPQRDDDPPFPTDTFELDDAIIHFRCGDLMASNHPSFGFMKFSGYTKHVSPDARSIGIVTQPFDDDAQSRNGDSRTKLRDRCRIVVLSLVDYIQERFPSSRIQIHNGPNETIALTYARMVMANQTIVGISSFGVFPAVATFGTGYLRRPDYRKAPNMWLLNPPIDELTDNVVLFEEPKRIMAWTIKGLWETHGEKGVLEWFWNDTVK